ncbi:WD40 repeat-like protein, partial [Ramicandelaber brevisporus]
SVRIQLPVAEALRLVDHDNAISCMAFDPLGELLVSGSLDYSARLWDFNRLDSRPRPHRTLESLFTNQDDSSGSYPVVDLQFSSSGNHILAVGGSNRPRILARNGDTVAEARRGDMYLRDVNKTRGHVAPTTGGQWHPTDDSDGRFMTCSEDGTVRFWRQSHCEESGCDQMIVMKGSGSSTRVPINTARYIGKDGNSIVAAQRDGGLSMWDTRRTIRPTSVVKNAFANDDRDACAISVSMNGHQFVTRSPRAFVQLWDIRKLTTPVAKTAVKDAVLNMLANAIFDTSGRSILTPGAPGQVAVLDASSSELKAYNTIELPSSERNVAKNEKDRFTRLYWHDGINQIAAGTTTGNIVVFFDKSMSVKGAVDASSRAPKRRGSFTVTGPIFTP